MRRQLRWYGASPLHLLALLACFGLAGYAAARLVSSHPVAVAAWFLGAVIGHDLLLMPLYSLADRSAMAALRHREPQLPAAPWINYVRVPAALSGLLLLVWFPLILRLRSPYHASTTLSADPYVWHWLAVTGTLFLLSAVAFALRLRGQSRTAAPRSRRRATRPRPRTRESSPAAQEDQRRPPDREDKEDERAAGELARQDDEAADDQRGTPSGQEPRAAEERTRLARPAVRPTAGTKRTSSRRSRIGNPSPGRQRIANQVVRVFGYSWEADLRERADPGRPDRRGLHQRAWA